MPDIPEGETVHPMNLGPSRRVLLCADARHWRATCLFPLRARSRHVQEKEQGTLWLPYPVACDIDGWGNCCPASRLSPDRHGRPCCYYLPRPLCTLHSRAAPRRCLVLRVPFASPLHRSRALLLLLLRSTPWLCLLLRPCRWTLPNLKLAASFLLVPCRLACSRTQG